MIKLRAFLAIFLTITLVQFSLAQSPHGPNLSNNCLDCHSVDGWDYIDSLAFNHSNTDFELEGSHTSVDCKSCHADLVFDNAINDCNSCHTDLHANSVGNDCARCHNSQNWLVDNIPQLHEENGFPLIGTHNTKACVACHKSDNNLVWNRIGNECLACHQQDYMVTKAPNHIEAQFSTNCEECHSPLATEWGAENFHLQFPLVYGHNTDCAACHTNGNYTSLSSECSSCHQVDFAATKEPNHQASGFSNTCIECHSPDPISWEVPGFHDVFTLENKHNTDCASCHTSQDFTQASPECVSCHLPDYSATKEPNHLASGMSNTCTECHSNTAVNWNVPNYHNSFPLTGSHDVDDCAACHKSENFYDISSECVSCHLPDYNATTQPNHKALNFDEDCTKCHTIKSWTPAKFEEHDNLYFPIYRGDHRGEWNSCTDCHTQSGNYSSFSCIDCHEHRKSEMDEEHRKEKDYRYESNACLECHPRP